MTPRRGLPYCVNHEPDADIAAIAARARSARRGPSAHLMEAVLSLTDRASIQVVLDAVVRLHCAQEDELFHALDDSA